jgi:hypothetical protein
MAAPMIDLAAKSDSVVLGSFYNAERASVKDGFGRANAVGIALA